VERIRILLGAMPRLLHDILCSAMAGESDLAVVGQLAEGDALLDAVRRTHPEVVVLGLEGDRPPILGELLGANPHVKVLTVSADGRLAAVHGMRRHVDHLGDASPGELLRAIRASVSTPRYL
jgi:DNA-binding NarL/FixJ family response regulator